MLQTSKCVLLRRKINITIKHTHMGGFRIEATATTLQRYNMTISSNICQLKGIRTNLDPQGQKLKKLWCIQLLISTIHFSSVANCFSTIWWIKSNIQLSIISIQVVCYVIVPTDVSERRLVCWKANWTNHQPLVMSVFT